jgi:hypothetical protein
MKSVGHWLDINKTGLEVGAWSGKKMISKNPDR